MDFKVGDIIDIPVITSEISIETIDILTQSCIDISRTEWDSRETSWDFKVNPLIEFVNSENNQIETSYNMWCKYALNQFIQLHENEEELNRLFIDIYGLQDEMTPDVDFEDITLFKKELKDRTGLVGAESISARNDENQLNGNNENHWADMESAPTGITKYFDKSEIIKQFISYAVGCMMGRYSIDKEGLIIANSDDKLMVGADSISAQNTESISDQNTPTITITGADGEIRHEIKNARYIPDADGIIPVTDREYFEDDIVSRFEEFVKCIYGEKTLDDNMMFIAEALDKKSTETAKECIRNYFLNEFMKDHIQRYKKRPIYWMFQSDKKGKAFNALVYMHRYDENTVGRIRHDYMLKYQARLESELKNIADDIDSVTGSERKNLEKQQTNIANKVNEIKKYDEKIKYFTEHKVSIDLDDGVMVNYTKLADILFEDKTITKKSE